MEHNYSIYVISTHLLCTALCVFQVGFEGELHNSVLSHFTCLRYYYYVFSFDTTSLTLPYYALKDIFVILCVCARLICSSWDIMVPMGKSLFFPFSLNIHLNANLFAKRLLHRVSYLHLHDNC